MEAVVFLQPLRGALPLIIEERETDAQTSNMPPAA
jgi:hypothetical protein